MKVMRPFYINTPVFKACTVRNLEEYTLLQSFFNLIERIYCHTSEHWKKGRDLNLAIFAKQTSPKHPECNVMQYQHVVQTRAKL